MIIETYQNNRMIKDYKIINTDKYKNNCLMKSEVGMAVLKSKQTRVVGIINTCIVHPSACFLSTSLAVSVNRSRSIT